MPGTKTPRSRAAPAFSDTAYKQISTGEGGLCITGDEALAARMALYADKCYPRNHWGMRTGRPCRFLAPNYRMSELCGAVGLAQLGKLESICARRMRIDELVLHVPRG